MSAVAESRVERHAQATVATLNLVDEQNPWLGLDSFSEETRQFFHGREEEIAELSRRVQRKTLAILFGQSGLGKTSILRAGIVPRLRREGYCPVYVRIDYSPDTPSPSEQIKQAIFKATEASGQWTKAGTAVVGESLWEFLHHRDDFLRDPSGRTLTPLLIFDQFEEIFTLAQDDDFGRKRAAEFIDDLADLVENRPPKALEAKLDHDDTIVERFDFSRADYRILIALREDYLAHMEGFKAAMPSITQNRMRLARMTGQQALAAVLKPGGKLVSEEVAESIVRFIAGGAELRNAEVEPSLLSLVCRELNNARVAQKRGEISADLLAGSRDTILHEFYERALADQPPGVRRFIEDEMLTESGFRESLAEERAVRGFATAGAAPNALATLVNRRLLRIEERLDVRRVELTHDVLCAVVKESRDLRHEREAKEAAQRELEAQRAREIATRKALVRARQVATGCAVLAIGAIAASIFGYQNMQRAQEAEAKALQTRAMAESARGEAEKLIVYLLDDFYLELEPVGRLDIVADLSKRALGYYAALPPELRTAGTERNQALAQVRYGHVLRYQSKADEGEKVLASAIGTLERLRAKGDSSELAAIGLGLGYAAMARVLDSQTRFAESPAWAAKAANILQPLMTKDASARLRRAYGSVMIYLGFNDSRQAREEEAVKALDLARETFRSIDGLKLDDLSSAAGFAEASAWQTGALVSLGQFGDARRVGAEGAAVSTQVLERRPGHMAALRSFALIKSSLADAEASEFHHARALPLTREAEDTWRSFLKLDSGNVIAWNNLAASLAREAFSLDSMGRSREAIDKFREILEIVRQKPDLSANFVFGGGRVSVLEAELGIPARKAEEAAQYRSLVAYAVRKLPPESFFRQMMTELVTGVDLQLLLVAGEYEGARALAQATIPRLEAMKPASDVQKRTQAHALANAHGSVAVALYNLGDLANANAAMRRSIQYLRQVPLRNRGDRLALTDANSMHALILARMGDAAGARRLIEPELKLHRQWIANGSDDLEQHTYLARLLLAQAIANPAEARPALAEAAAVVGRFPQDMARRRTVAQLRGWINDEMAKRL